MMPDLHDYGMGEAPKPPRSFPPDRRPRGWTVVPETLPDLMVRAGPYADAAKAHLEWSAVTAWLMKDGDKALAAAFIPVQAANLSVLLARHAAEHEANWPKLSDNPVPPALYDLPEDAQVIARRMAYDIYDLWEAAGRPYLRASDFKFAFQYLVAAIRKGIIPPVPTIGDVSR
ncbi:hypothetical protein ACMGDM_04365 [Sphingomonas sp. DT-51]|uniref:hypothetical protein n=1 Tax=Sphingomonas sp. DT-51 TaxID=3396165 RepID=UPI003F1C965C